VAAELVQVDANDGGDVRFFGMVSADAGDQVQGGLPVLATWAGLPIAR
jgi:hypothetical protein